MLRFCCLCLILSLAVLPSAAEVSAPAPLSNGSLESWNPGGDPIDWFMPNPSREAGYTLTEATEEAHHGERYARLATDHSPAEGFGNLMRSIDAVPFRGQTVRLTAWVRARVSGFANRGQMWLRVDRPDRQMGFFDNMGDRPITSNQWTQYTIEGEVAPDAQRIALGVMLIGQGELDIDHIELSSTGTTNRTAELPRPLTEQGLTNLTVLTRLLGYVRFFHPSDEAAAADWDSLAIAAVKFVEDAKDADDLATRLGEAFAPAAPTLRIERSGQGFELPAELAKPPADEPFTVVTWRHSGAGVLQPGGGSVYNSQRPGRGGDAAVADAYYYRAVPPTRFLGKRLRVTGELWAADTEPGAYLSLTAAGNRRSLGVDQMDGRSVTSPEWAKRSVSLEIDPATEQIMLAFGVEGLGEARFRNLRLGWAERGSDDWHEEALLGDGADADGPKWKFRSSGDRVVFSHRIEEEQGDSGASLAVITAVDGGSDQPVPGRPLALKLGGDLLVHLPLAVYATEVGTVPRGQVAGPAPWPENWIPTGDDRATRLAGVMLAWTVFQHFYPYFDVVDTDWDAALTAALTAAAEDPGEYACLRTLRRMVAKLHDGHGNVSHPCDDRNWTLPLQWVWIGDELVVTKMVTAGGLSPGAAVVSVDGVATREAAAAAELEISGATPQWRRYRSARILRSGSKDAVKLLQVRDPDGTVHSVRLSCNLSPREGYQLREDRPDTVAQLEPGIWYVDIDRLSPELWRRRVVEIAQGQGVVFDLRGYPRRTMTETIAHIIDTPVTSPQWHVPLVVRPDRMDMGFDFRNWEVQPRLPVIEGKIVYLTDGRAISAAETYMGIIEGYDLAPIVGGATAGTNGNVNPFVVPGGYRISWTGMKVLKHDGSRHHGVGILPTVPVTRTAAGIAAGRDEVLEAGLAEVKKR